ELKSRRHGTTDKSEGAKAARALPPAGRDNLLRPLASTKPLSEDQGPNFDHVRRNFQFERSTGVMMPDLGGVAHAMPGRLFPGAQQKRDGRRMAAAICGNITESLGKPAALGMTLQTERSYDSVGLWRINL